MWHKVAKIGDIAEGAAQRVDVAGKAIAVFNLKGKFYAIENTCPHRGGPLSEGHLEGTVVTCPWHAWDFDVTTGECKTMPGPAQKKYPTKIEANQIYIDI